MLTRKLVARAKKRGKKREREANAGFGDGISQEGGGERKRGRKGERERSREQDIVAHCSRQRRMHRVAPTEDYAHGISTRTRAADQSIRKIYGTDDGART